VILRTEEEQARVIPKLPPVKATKATIAAAKRYWMAWPAERDAIVARFERAMSAERVRFGVETDDELRDAVRKTFEAAARGKTGGSVGFANPEVYYAPYRAEVMYLRNSLDVEKELHTVLFGRGGSTIARPAEAAAINRMALTEIRDRIVPISFQIIHLGIYEDGSREVMPYAPENALIDIPDEDGDIEASSLPTDSEPMRALQRVCDFANAGGVERQVLWGALQSDEYWTLGREFTRSFYSWRAQQITKAGPAALPVQRRQYRTSGPLRDRPKWLASTAKPITDGLRRAMISADGYELPARGVPTLQYEGFTYTYGGEPGKVLEPEHALKIRQDFIRQLGVEMFLLWRFCNSRWLEANRGREKGAYATVTVNVDEFLELGPKQKHHKGGYRDPQKRAIAERFAHLNEFWLTGYYENNGKRLSIRGRSIEVSYAEDVDLIGNRTPYAFLIRPSAGVELMIIGDDARHGHFDASLMKLDVSHQSGTLAAMIGLYLDYQYPIRRKNGTLTQPYFVRTLLDGSQIPIETDSKRYGRFRETIGKALDQLCKVGYIKDWRYAAGDEDKLPERGWFAEWLSSCRILIYPADSAAQISGDVSDAPQEAAAPAEEPPRRRGKRRERSKTSSARKG
jgi:hypothetical protein